MDSNDLKGLLASAGKALGRLPASDRIEVVARLRASASPADFRNALDGVDLGMADAAARRLVEAIAGHPRWLDYCSRLLRLTDASYHEHCWPGS